MPGKMVMCIVHLEDVDALTHALNPHALNRDGFRVTRMSTTGGFLRQGNASLMIGVDADKVDDVLKLIRENSHPRSRKGWWARPGEHEEGAATVFVLDMEQTRLPE
jgi:uncharacterized protein YaaQ